MHHFSPCFVPSFDTYFCPLFFISSHDVPFRFKYLSFHPLSPALLLFFCTLLSSILCFQPSFLLSPQSSITFSSYFLSSHLLSSSHPPFFLSTPLLHLISPPSCHLPSFSHLPFFFSSFLSYPLSV